MIDVERTIVPKSKFKTIRLGDIVEDLQAGFACGKFELDEGDFAHLRPMNIDYDCKLTWKGTKYIAKDFFEERKNYSLKKGDILFNNTNSTELVGKSCYIKEDIDCGFSNHMTRIRVDRNKVDSIYLSNLLYGMWMQKILESYCHKWVGQSGINTEILSNIPIIIPPLKEQQQIASLFQSIETAIEQVEGQEGNLKALQKTLSNGLVSNPPIFGNLLTAKNCKSCSFGDIVSCMEQHDKKPLENGISRFVGLENIEPGNFNLQGYGNIENGTTFSKIFSTGDVLFGKRRAYLKKIAIADFDGICSGDILVLRAKEKVMLPELLPYYASSEAFIQKAINTSAGSLSPRTKWKDLATFEVAIPDIKTQEKIVGMFNQLRESLNLLTQQKETLKKLKQKLLNEILE